MPPLSVSNEITATILIQLVCFTSRALKNGAKMTSAWRCWTWTGHVEGPAPRALPSLPLLPPFYYASTTQGNGEGKLGISGKKAWFFSYTSDVQRTNHSIISAEPAALHKAGLIPATSFSKLTYEKKDFENCPKLVTTEADISTLDVFKDFDFQVIFRFPMKREHFPPVNRFIWIELMGGVFFVVKRRLHNALTGTGLINRCVLSFG